MVQMEIIEHKWNEKYEYMESNLKRRETLKFKDAVDVLETLKEHQDKFNQFKITDVIFFPRYYSEIIKIKTNRNVDYNFKFTDKQRMRIKDLLVELNNGNEIEKRW